MTNYQDLISWLRGESAKIRAGASQLYGTSHGAELSVVSEKMRQAADALSAITSPVESEGELREIYAVELERVGYPMTANLVRENKIGEILEDKIAVAAIRTLSVVAARVRASTREECARFCETNVAYYRGRGPVRLVLSQTGSGEGRMLAQGIRALPTPPQPEKEDGWKLIDGSEPQDGTQFFVACEVQNNKTGKIHWDYNVGWRDEGILNIIGDDGWYETDYTHWKLPTPPQSEKED